MTSLVRTLVAFIVVLASLVSASPVGAAEGELRWALHVTRAARWLDPAETEAFNTPYMVIYAVHDALVKPMAAGSSRSASGAGSVRWSAPPT
jgi:hypothetical protein